MSYFELQPEVQSQNNPEEDSGGLVIGCEYLSDISRNKEDFALRGVLGTDHTSKPSWFMAHSIGHGRISEAIEEYGGNTTKGCTFKLDKHTFLARGYYMDDTRHPRSDGSRRQSVVMDVVSDEIFKSPQQTTSLLRESIRNMGGELLKQTLLYDSDATPALYINLTVMLGPQGEFYDVMNLRIPDPDLDT